MWNQIILRSLAILMTFSFSTARAGEPSSSVYLQLQKLYSLKRVLYVAAHPDDENTRALAWLSLGEKAETAYFSLTRGDGGQNLIGNELGDDLGVLRTQELLAARSHDHAKQYFSRAVDFGFSKSADESFEKWGKEVLLEDLVLMIRRFKPDVIITRFPPDERAGHGHHTSSALLAIEAFEKANDPNYKPEQVNQYGTWQTSSIYWNTSVWWDKEINENTKNDPSYLIQDIGGYSPLLGMSYNEIGTLARSQHKCQGFGDVLERGERLEYFKHLGGKQLNSSFFEYNTRSWGKLLSSDVEKHFQELLHTFDRTAPQNNVPALLQLLEMFQSIKDPILRQEKTDLCKEIIADCLGLNIELLGDDYAYAAGDSISLEMVLLNRSDLKLKFKGLMLKTGEIVRYNDELKFNQPYKKKIQIAGLHENSTPYWLKDAHSDVYVINDKKNLLKAENDPTIAGFVMIEVDGQEVQFNIKADYKWRDPSYGERRRPLIISPALTATLDQELLLCRPGETKEVLITFHAYTNDIYEKVSLKLPSGWVCDRQIIEVNLAKKQAEQSVKVSLTAEKNAVAGEIELVSDKWLKLMSSTEIKYDHIPTQVIFKPSKITCVPLNVETAEGIKVAYIKGTEDAVPTAIRQMGIAIDEYEVSDLAKVDWDAYTTVVLGIRIYNVHPELSNFNSDLEKFVRSGGNLIIQYNTASRSGDFRPFSALPFKIGRDRVTEEDAEVTFLMRDHPLLKTPNLISSKDFEGWVQERGLYFAEDWDEAYQPVFSWSDKGEDAKKGALIVASLGKGQVVYTGISFFRELPKGVIGAYRLFANLLAYNP